MLLGGQRRNRCHRGYRSRLRRHIAGWRGGDGLRIDDYRTGTGRNGLLAMQKTVQEGRVTLLDALNARSNGCMRLAKLLTIIQTGDQQKNKYQEEKSATQQEKQNVKASFTVAENREKQTEEGGNDSMLDFQG